MEMEVDVVEKRGRMGRLAASSASASASGV